MSNSRDQKLIEALQLFSAALENAVQVLKQELAKIDKQPAQSGLTEDVFNLLRWEPGKGQKLGEFEAAYKNSNNIDTWQHCFNILRANNATLQNHFGLEDWPHYYWLYLDRYNDRIFRKSRETEKAI